MKSGVITQHNRDSCSDKIEQLLWHVKATFVWQRPSEIWKKKKRMRRAHLNIWFYFLLLSWGIQNEGGGGCYWMTERIAGSSSNWNLRRTKSVFHVCMQLLPKGSTHLLPPPPPPLYCPWPPPTGTQKPHSSAIPTNDCVSCTRLTTLHLTIYWGGDNCALRLIMTKWHHWKLPIPALSVKSEARGILCILCAGERLSDISFAKYQPLKPECHVLHSTLHFLTWHNHWSNNGRQAKAWA